MKPLAFTSVLACVLACTNSDPAKSTPTAKTEAAPDTKPDSTKATPGPATEPEEPAKPDDRLREPGHVEPGTLLPAPPTAPPGEVAINPWTSVPHTATWRVVAEPTEALAFVDLQAGVLAQAGTAWYQLGEGEALVALTMDAEPQPPVLGVWPSDAWFVESRFKGEGEEEILELRLMKWRGNRWVPQVFDGGGGEQWFHPGTDHEFEPHMSTLSGMLVYTDEFDSITRVAGKHGDPELGPHRGSVVDFIETGAHESYVLSAAPDGYFAQIACEDEECVAANAKKLPMPEWVFERAVPRGRHSVSVYAIGCASRTDAGTMCDPASSRDFILHHRGKSDGWVLDEMPAGEGPPGMWASEEGGLWTLAGDKLRWRDTDSVWHDVALPEGLVGPSIALTEDRKQIWIAGQVAGATKVFGTTANAEVPAPAAPAPAPAP